ncbi:MAG: hypothetical protein JNK05_03380 [Myxococcales bacterium]|nr:hypothetical protein [Myxococcales bacterium]
MSFAMAMGMGFALGLRHAMDADHVAAVATLLRREQRLLGAMRVGALWGAGHSATLLAAGAALIVFQRSWVQRLEGIGEVLVCAMLIGLGLLGLVRASRGALVTQRDHPRLGRAAWGAFGVGAVHGLAGTAATALLAASATGGRGATMLFLALFAVGTITGMSAMTVALSVGLRGAAARSARVYRGILLVASALSLAVGLVLARGLLARWWGAA